MLHAKRSHLHMNYVLDQAASILFADDDPILREFAMVHLSSPIVTVDVARDGAEAWEMIASNAYDIAVVDLEMPRLGGLGLIMRIRADARLAALPVVVATGRDDLFAIDRSYEVGATSYVTKPINWRLLTYQLKLVLRGNLAASLGSGAA